MKPAPKKEVPAAKKDVDKTLDELEMKEFLEYKRAKKAK